MADPLAMKISERLRQLRADCGLTTLEMATECGIPKPTLEQLLAGRHAPKASSLKAISEAFFVSIDWLVCGEEFQTRRQP